MIVILLIFPVATYLNTLINTYVQFFLRMRDIPRGNHDNAKMKDLLLDKLLPRDTEI